MHELMGKIVLVDRMFQRTYDGNSPSNSAWKGWYAVKAEGRPGWVVGERWLQEGIVYYGCDNYHAEATRWERTLGHSLHCLLVCYWPTMKPVRVPFDGYRMAAHNIAPYPSTWHWSHETRKFMQKEMRDWPRDARGRWVKKKRHGDV